MSSALAWRVSMPVSLDEGDQLMSTNGKDLRPSLWVSSYDSTT